MIGSNPYPSLKLATIIRDVSLTSSTKLNVKRRAMFLLFSLSVYCQQENISLELIIIMLALLSLQYLNISLHLDFRLSS